MTLKMIFKNALVKNSFIKNTGIYTISNVLTSAIPLLLMPLLTKYLAPEDYAKVEMFSLLNQFFIPLIGLNAYSALSRYFFDVEETEFRKYVGATISLVIIFFIFFLILVAPLRHFITRYTTLTSLWIYLAVFYAVSNNIIQTLLNIWQAKFKALEYGVFRITRVILDISMSLILIVIFKYTWEGRILGQFIATLIFMIITFIIIHKRKELIFSVDWNHVKNILFFGIPLIPHVISGVVITYTDRLFITNIIGLKETGYYAVGYQIGMVIYILQNSFNQVWVPWLFKILKDDNLKTKKKIVKGTYLYFVLILISAILLSLVAPTIYRIFISKNYIGGLPYVFFIALGFAFNGMYKMVVAYIFYIKKTYIIAISTISVALLNITLNYFLVRRNGGVGAAQACAISYFVEFIVIWIISMKLYDMPWFSLSRIKN